MAHDLIPLRYFTNLEIQQYKVLNAEQTSTRIGMIRLRQLRAKKGKLHWMADWTFEWIILIKINELYDV